MKRIVGFLASLLLVGSMALSVIGCSPKTPYAVILELQTDNQASSIVQAYRNVVNQYNNDRPRNSRPLKLMVTRMNSIKDKIATGLPLPNLYVAYSDSIANYDILLRLLDNNHHVVNIAEVINWDPGKVGENQNWWQSEASWILPYLSNGQQVNPHGLTGDQTLNEISKSQTYRPFINSFLRESLIPGATENSIFMYSAPTAKSMFFGAANLRLLNEIIIGVLGPDARLEIIDKNRKKIRDPYFIKNINNKNLATLRLNDSMNPYPLSFRNRYKSDSHKTFGDFFRESFKKPIAEFELQKMLGDLSHVEILLSAYWNLVGESETNTADKWIKTLSYGTDDVNATIGLMQAQATHDFQPLTTWDAKQPYHLLINTKDPELHQGVTDFIDFVRWGNDYKPLRADSASGADHGKGGIGLKANSISKDYYSNQWIRQGMLLYYGSSAGVKYMAGTGEDQVQVDEIMLAPIPTYQDWSQFDSSQWNLLFRQQGAGIAMFKDNEVEKNKIAIDFLNYFLSPQVNTEFAIQAGYIPTHYEAYHWPSGELGPYHQELDSPQTRIKGAKIIKNLVDQLVSEQIKLWVTNPSPFGQLIDFQVIQPWFKKYYKTFFDGGPKSSYLTWNQFEKDLHREALRVVNSFLPGFSHLVWNGKLEN